MKRVYTCLIILIIFPVFLCSCWARGPFPPPLNQPISEVTRIDFVDGTEEADLYNNRTYPNCVIYTLDTEQTIIFLEGLSTIEFYIPPFEPSRHLGEIAARIYYKDGSSDLIGNNCSYYNGPNFELWDMYMKTPKQEPFYALFEQFVDPELLPRR